MIAHIVASTGPKWANSSSASASSSRNGPNSSPARANAWRWVSVGPVVVAHENYPVQIDQALIDGGRPAPVAAGGSRSPVSRAALADPPAHCVDPAIQLGVGSRRGRGDRRPQMVEPVAGRFDRLGRTGHRTVYPAVSAANAASPEPVPGTSTTSTGSGPATTSDDCPGLAGWRGGNVLNAGRN